MKCKILLRIFSEIYSTSIWKERFTDTIIENEELSWSSDSSGGYWLIVNFEFCSLKCDKKKIQVREVRNWEGGRKEVRLVELSRWIEVSYWILWTCTGYLYPDGHVSLQFWVRANRIIWWGNRERVGWFYRSEPEATKSFVLE